MWLLRSELERAKVGAREIQVRDEGGLGLGVGRDYQGPNGRRWGPWSMDYESPSSRPLSCLRWREGRQPHCRPSQHLRQS